MVELTSLPHEILSIIIVMVAISREGAKDIVKISATCKKFFQLAKQSCVLKVVKFQSLTFTPNYIRHLNPRGILLQCAHYGNLDALPIIGKALLERDMWFWGMVMCYKDLVCQINGSFIYTLEYVRLVVKEFIIHGSSEDISKILWPLCGYIMTANPTSEDYRAVSNMCFYEQKRCGIIAFFTKLSKKLNRFPLNDYLVEVMQPHNATDHIKVVKILDKLFPATSG